MTKADAYRYVKDHADDDELDEEDLIDVFTALYERGPDAQEMTEGLWTHCCAACL
jgi:hypothetical protein